MTIEVGDFKSQGTVPEVADIPNLNDLSTVEGPCRAWPVSIVSAPNKLTIDYKARRFRCCQIATIVLLRTINDDGQGLF